MSEHTPGPWGLVEERTENHDREFYVTGTDHGLVAEAYEVADARLIAAAPDLLAALEAAWPGLSGQSYERPISEVWEQARSAIAKAKGEV